jgi:hypothetical protein
MKKILLTTFSFLGIIASAQTITEGSHAPMNNDAIFGTYQCDSTGITAGGAGTGQSWNFSSFAPHIYILLKLYNTSNTTPGVAEYSAANVVSFFIKYELLSYYNSDVNSLKYYGGSLTIGAIGVKLVYNNPSSYCCNTQCRLNSATTSNTNRLYKLYCFRCIFRNIYR